MPVLVGKLNNLVFNRWTIAWTNSRNFAGIEGRLMQVIADRLVQPFACKPDKTLYLILLYFLRGE